MTFPCCIIIICHYSLPFPIFSWDSILVHEILHQRITIFNISAIFSNLDTVVFIRYPYYWHNIFKNYLLFMCMCVSLRAYLYCVPAGDCEEQMRMMELPELELQAGHWCHVGDRQYISALWKTGSHRSTHEFHILCHCQL